jgi:prevent-host-death family protein
MQSWQMQNAKARFSELVKCAVENGPQEITLYGRAKAVVVSRELFDRLSGNEQSLVDFMRASPLAEHDEIAFERDRGPDSLPREIRF